MCICWEAGEVEMDGIFRVLKEERGSQFPNVMSLTSRLPRSSFVIL